MIAPLNLLAALPLSAQPHNSGATVRLMDVLRDEAALELDAALHGATGKRIARADVPGASRTGLSRAANGCESNPLYRLAAVLVLMKRLGMGRERALRLVDWLRELVDQIWPEEEEARDFGEVMGAEQAIDGEEDRYQVDACLGIPGAAERMLEVVRQRRAHDAVVISALRRRIAEQG